MASVQPVVSIIIPTYNEAENIVPIVDAVLEATVDVDAEVIVVDDDSPDETARIARDAYGGDGRVHVLVRMMNPGLGEAVVDGFTAASGDYCAVIDADFQHPPSKLQDFIDVLDTTTDASDGTRPVDVVIGSRYIEGGGIEGWSRWRRLVSWGGGLISTLSLPSAWRVSDPMSGFFAVRTSLVQNTRLDPDGYKILLEVLERTSPRRVVEVPYVFRERRAGESKLDAGETIRFVEHASTLSIGDVQAARADVVFVAWWFLCGLLFGQPVLAAVGALLVACARGWDLGRRIASVDVEVMA